MSIVACVKVYDGMALGAESMSQILGKQPGGQSQFMKAYSNARKLFEIKGAPFGVLAYGAGNIGNRSIESFLYEFSGMHDFAADTGEQIAHKLLQFMRAPYDSAFGQSPDPQKPVLGFYLAGYSPEQHLGTEWEFVFPQDLKPRQPRPDNQCGASWRGIAIPFIRQYNGIDPRFFGMLQAHGVANDVIAKVQAAAQQLVSPIVLDGMPLQDAIGYCKYILDTTIGAATYEAGVPTCGGPLQIAIITRGDGFKWVSRPAYSI